TPMDAVWSSVEMNELSINRLVPFEESEGHSTPDTLYIPDR
ncbi:4775_t:CDS:1, partial [Acaulospora colombiana]